MVRFLVVVLLLVYTVVLLAVEWSTSQQYVRHFVTDITGPVPLYAVNTTLSVFLLWGTALVFAVAARFPARGDEPSSEHASAAMFCWSQVLMFAWLGFDDRFQAHEKISYRLGIGDHYVLLLVAVVQVLVLVFFRRVWWPNAAARRMLAAAAVLFAFMLFVDACVPHEMRMRLSVEDLAKTWATFCLFLFGWRQLTVRIDAVGSGASPKPAAAAVQEATPAAASGRSELVS